MKRAIIGKHVLGLEVEVEFHQLYEKQPTFSDIDMFVRESLKLELQDLRKTYWKYTQGVGYGTTKGQLIFGDALYFRSPQSILKLGKDLNREEMASKIIMACLMAIVYGYIDYALFLLSLSPANEYLDKKFLNNFQTIIKKYGKTPNFNLRSVPKLGMFFYYLFRFFQPSHRGWASVGDKLGSRKKFGAFF